MQRREQLVLCGTEPVVAETKGKTRKRRKRGLDMKVHPDGTIEVRHAMKERAVEIDRKLFAEEAPVGRVWNQIAKVGSWAGHPTGPFQLNETHFEEMVRNFRATQNRRIQVDFEHASEADGSAGSIPVLGAPAQAWIYELDNRGSDGLWALMEWLEPARTYVREGKYQFISPAVHFNARDRVSGERIGARLRSAGLTNNPFLDGMQRLAARDEAEDDSDDADNSEGEEPEETSPEETKTMSETIKLKELEAQTATLSLQLKDAIASKEAVEKRLVDAEAEAKMLRDWRTEREEKDIQNEVDIAFETYKDSKRLRDSDRAAMLVVAKNSFDAFRQLYPRVPVAQRALLRSVASEGARPLNKQPDNLFSLADSIQRDNPGMDREDAICAADKQLRSARGRRAG